MLFIDDRHVERAYFDACYALFARHPLLRPCYGRRYAVCVAEPAFGLALCLYLKAHGGTVFPMPADSPRLLARQRAERSGCEVLIFGAPGESGEDALACAERIERGDALHDDGDGALLQMSSGTTGEPKFIARAWSSIDAETEAYVERFDPAHRLQPIVACPITHSYGLISGILVALRRGLKPLVVQNLNPKYVLRKVYEAVEPILYSSPTFLATVTMLAPAERPIHAVMSSGTLMQKACFDGVRAKVTHLHQQYGCSEAGCITLGEDIHERSEVGRPLPHIELTAGDSQDAPREIIATPLGQRAIATHDLGYLERGSLFYVSRLDDMINVSGRNVYPGEVEEVVMAMPAVRDAVVFKAERGFGGDRVCLAYVAESPLSDSEIREWCGARLASHQVPTRIARVDSIPRAPSGKVSRRALAQSAC